MSSARPVSWFTSLGEAAETHRITARGRPTRYLKMAGELEREHARLLWAAGRLPVPHVVAFATEAGRDYLLLDELPGTPIELATECSVAERVARLAQTMRSFHHMPIAGCLFDACVRERLVDAEANVRTGNVDESDFDPEQLGCKAHTATQHVEWHRQQCFGVDAAAWRETSSGP